MTQPMHVCDITTLFIDSAGGGGVNTYLAAKARDFARRPDVVHTIIVPGECDDLVEDWCGTGARLYKVASRRLPWNREHRVMFRLREVQRIVRAARPDVVEVDCAFWFARSVARALRGLDVPILGVYHVHLPAIAGTGSRLGRCVAAMSARGAWRYTRFCMSECDRILVTSTTTRDDLRRLGVDNLEFVPLGVDVGTFRPEPSVGGAARASTIGGRILYVGRLSPEKELDVLLDAYQRLPRHFTLDIVGDGPLRKRLERVASGDPRIRVLGPCRYGKALAACYHRAEVFVTPGSHETFGLAVLEAAACGVPVVAADGGGVTDTVTAEVGVRVTPGDADAFARGIEAVVARREAGEFATISGHIAKNWSWERCFQRLLGVYDSAVGVRGRSRPRHARPAALLPLRRVR